MLNKYMQLRPRVWFHFLNMYIILQRKKNLMHINRKKQNNTHINKSHQTNKQIMYNAIHSVYTSISFYLQSKLSTNLNNSCSELSV